MLDRWLSIIGIGDDGWASLSPIAKSLLAQAKIVVGGERHLALIPPGSQQQQLVWTTPIGETIAQILAQSGQPICILASGDPLCYGIGSTMLRHIPIDQMTIVPAPSAFSWARSRLGWSSTEVETVSLCGRDPHLINALLYPGAKILALSADRHTPSQVAKILGEQGQGEVQITVLEHLGGSAERLIATAAAAWSAPNIAQLNMIALCCPSHIAGYSRLAGLPDAAYRHDGQLTKREIRAVTLAALAPLPGQTLWDVGAGNGSISIEWLRSHPRNRAMAIEQHPQRQQNLADNAIALGVPNLEIIAGTAPAALSDLPRPNAVFIGGGLTIPAVFETCWLALQHGGRLVANAVTVETEQQILQLHSQYGGTLSRIAIQRAEPVGKFLGWKALAPVTQWSVVKNS